METCRGCGLEILEGEVKSGDAECYGYHQHRYASVCHSRLKAELTAARAEVAEAKQHAANLADSLSYYEKRAVDEAVARMNVKQQLDAERARVDRMTEALGEIGEGVGCNSTYGPGCDRACKAIAFRALNPPAAAMPGSAEREGPDA